MSESTIELPQTICRFCGRMTGVNGNGTYALHATLDSMSPLFCAGSYQLMTTIEKKTEPATELEFKLPPPNWEGTITTTRERPPTVGTQLQLSLIYKKLLKDLKLCRRSSEQAQAMEMVNEAFNRALQHLSQRCSKCDSEDLLIACRDCGERNL